MSHQTLWVVTSPWSQELASSLLAIDGSRVFRSLDGALLRAYSPTAERPALPASASGARTAAVKWTFEVRGASFGSDAPFHYVVSTDVLPDWEAEMNDWYDTEHMPGLAAVPGTVLAQRYVDEDGSPRYHASYDLATRAAFNSEPWLAVRATDWSSRVRPAFRNTERVMYERVR